MTARVIVLGSCYRCGARPPARCPCGGVREVSCVWHERRMLCSDFASSPTTRCITGPLHAKTFLRVLRPRPCGEIRPLQSSGSCCGSFRKPCAARGAERQATSNVHDRRCHNPGQGVPGRAIRDAWLRRGREPATGPDGTSATNDAVGRPPAVPTYGFPGSSVRRRGPARSLVVTIEGLVSRPITGLGELHRPAHTGLVVTHCFTKWPTLHALAGVRRSLLASVDLDPNASWRDRLLATRLPDDPLRGRAQQPAFVAVQYDGQHSRRAGGPARLVSPARYVWKAQVAASSSSMTERAWLLGGTVSTTGDPWLESVLGRRAADTARADGPRVSARRHRRPRWDPTVRSLTLCPPHGRAPGGPALGPRLRRGRLQRRWRIVRVRTRSAGEIDITRSDDGGEVRRSSTRSCPGRPLEVRGPIGG